MHAHPAHPTSLPIRALARTALLIGIVACDGGETGPPASSAGGGDTDGGADSSTSATGTGSASDGSTGTAAASTGGGADTGSLTGDGSGTAATTSDSGGSTGGGSTAGTSGDPGTGATLEPSCGSELDPAVNGTFVALCAVDGKVGHVRLTNLVVPPMHASTQVFLGMAGPPAGPQAPLDPGQFKLLFYGGAGGAPPPIVQVVFGASAVDLSLDGGFLATPSTVCFDVHDGAPGLAPAVVLWRSGEGGADCADPSTLTVASAAAVVDDFAGEVGAIAEGTSYARQSAGEGTLAIELRNTPVTERSAVDGRAGG
jgi:hypothetical protein